MLIVPLLCKDLIASIRISRRELIHTEVKVFTAVLIIVFKKLIILNRKKIERNWIKVYFFFFLQFYYLFLFFFLDFVSGRPDFLDAFLYR